MTSATSLLAGYSLMQALSNELSVLLRLGTGTFGMSSAGLFSSNPVTSNPSTQPSGSSTSFQAFNWNGGHIPPPIPIFGTKSAQNSGPVIGFNLFPSPHMKTSGASSSATFVLSTPVFSICKQR